MKIYIQIAFLFLTIESFSQTKDIGGKSDFQGVKYIGDEFLVVVSDEGKKQGNRNYKITIFDKNIDVKCVSHILLNSYCFLKEAVSTKDGFLIHMVDKLNKISHTYHIGEKGNILKERILDRSEVTEGEKYYPTYFGSKENGLFAFQNVKNKEYNGFKVSKFNSQLGEDWKVYIERDNEKMHEGIDARVNDKQVYLLYQTKENKKPSYTDLKIVGLRNDNGKIVNTTDFEESYPSMTGFNINLSHEKLYVTGYSSKRLFKREYDLNLNQIDYKYLAINDEELNKVNDKHFFGSSFVDDNEDVWFVVERYSIAVAPAKALLSATSTSGGFIGSVSPGIGGTHVSYSYRGGGVYGSSGYTKIVTQEFYIFHFNNEGQFIEYKTLEKRNGNPNRNIDMAHDFEMSSLSDFRYLDYNNLVLGATTYDTGNKVHKIFDYNTGETKTYDLPGGKVNDVYRLGDKSIMLYNDGGMKLKVLE